MQESTLPAVDLAISEIREAIRRMESEGERQANNNRQKLNEKRHHLKEYLEKRAQLELESALQNMFGSNQQLEQQRDCAGYTKEYWELYHFIRVCREQSYRYVTEDMLQTAEVISEYYKRCGGVFERELTNIAENNRTTLRLVKQILVANTEDNRDALMSHMQKIGCGDYHSVKRKSNAAIGIGALMIFLGVASFAAGVFCIASLALLPVGFGLLFGTLVAVFGTLSITCGRAQFSKDHPHFALQSFVRGAEPYTFFGKVTKSTHKAVVERENERARAGAR